MFGICNLDQAFKYSAPIWASNYMASFSKETGTLGFNRTCGGPGLSRDHIFKRVHGHIFNYSAFKLGGRFSKEFCSQPGIKVRGRHPKALFVTLIIRVQTEVQLATVLENTLQEVF